MSKWDKAIAALETAKDGSYDLDLLIYASHTSSADPIPHYASMYFDAAREWGEAVNVSTDMSHCLKFIEEQVGDCDITLNGCKDGWSCGLTHRELGLSVSVETPSATPELALLRGALALEGPVYRARFDTDTPEP